MMARVAAFTVLALVAVAGSSTLTRAIMTCRKVKVHVLSIDEVIDSVKAELGLKPEDVEDFQVCDPGALPDGSEDEDTIETEDKQ